MGTTSRDRRDRGMRGPAFGIRPGRDRVPAHRTASERFDALALGVMQELWERFPEELGGVQLGVEEVPLLPAGWSEDTVPLASYVAARAGSPARVVLLRRPIEHRARDRAELEALVLTVLVEQVAEVLGLPPEDVHPDYDPD
ncbi:MAG: metallopeptidase family protein [Marmoricola sp.]